MKDTKHLELAYQEACRKELSDQNIYDALKGIKTPEEALKMQNRIIEGHKYIVEEILSSKF